MFRFFADIWKKNIGGKLTLIFCAVILVAAPTLIVWAVTTRHGDESFMIASDGEPYRWTDLPIGCLYDDSLTGSDLETVESVRSEYAAKLGYEVVTSCKHLLTVTQPISGYISLSIRPTPNDEHAGGSTLLISSPKPHMVVNALILVHPQFRANRSVWMHEFGHALGLAHDRLTDSIMYPIIQERPGKLSDKDVEALRKVYGRAHMKIQILRHNEIFDYENDLLFSVSETPEDGIEISSGLLDGEKQANLHVTREIAKLIADALYSLSR